MRAQWRLALIFLLATAAMALFDHIASDYGRTLASLILLQIALAVSLQFTNGLTGLFSLGHPAFMTIGAYVAAILTYPARRKGFMMPDLPPALAASEWELLPAVIAGAAVAALSAVPIGVSVLRLRGHYLAVATLGLVVVVRTVVNNLDGWTRGGLGLSGVPRETTLWHAWVFALLAIWVAWRVKHSSLGRAMLAVRGNELAARCLGIDAFALRLFAFITGAAFAGAAGALTVHLVSVVTPGAYGIPLAFTLVAITVVGGTGSITGAVIAAVAIGLLSEMLKPLEEGFGLYGLSQVLVAAMLLAVLVWRPDGLFGSREPTWLEPRPLEGRHSP